MVDPAADIAQRTPVTTHALRVALAGMALLAIGAIGWGIFGRAPATVEGQGLVLPAGGYAEIGTTVEGVVDSVLLSPGSVVAPGTPAAVVTTAEGTDVNVTSTVSGEVVEVTARPGRRTSLGQPMAVVQPTGSALIVKALLPAGPAELVRPGMTALVSPASAPRQQYGYLDGRVTSLAPAAASRDRLLTILGDNQVLVDYVLAGGPVQEVTIELPPADTPSGYRWTIGDGPHYPLSPSTVATVVVILDDRPIVGWMFR